MSTIDQSQAIEELNIQKQQSHQQSSLAQSINPIDILSQKLASAGQSAALESPLASGQQQNIQFQVDPSPLLQGSVQSTVESAAPVDPPPVVKPSKPNKQPEPPNILPKCGFGLNDLQILKELGKGGFGSVYLARLSQDAKMKIHKDIVQNMQKSQHLKPGAFGATTANATFRAPQAPGHLPDIVALKKVYMDHKISQSKMQNVIKEAFFDMENVQIKYLQTEKNNSPKITYSKEYRYVFCILMEYADKGDLNQLIDRHRREKTLIAEDAIWKYASQICEGLSYLHSQNIIHRDIKPQNIFISKNGRIQIGDLGISRTVQGDQQNLHISKIGTPLYLSPEVLRKQPFDYKIDIWAFGCVLYFLACLEPAFSTVGAEKSPRNHGNLTKRQKLEHMILNSSPKLIPNTYSSILQLLINQLLDKNPMNRPTAEELCKIISNECSAAKNQQFNYSGMGFASTPRQTVCIPRIKNKQQIKEEGKYNRSDEIKIETNSYSNQSPVTKRGKNNGTFEKIKLKQQSMNKNSSNVKLIDMVRESNDDHLVISSEKEQLIQKYKQPYLNGAPKSSSMNRNTKSRGANQTTGNIAIVDSGFNSSQTKLPQGAHPFNPPSISTIQSLQNQNNELLTDVLNSLKTRHIQKRGIPKRLPAMPVGSIISEPSEKASPNQIYYSNTDRFNTITTSSKKKNIRQLNNQTTANFVSKSKNSNQLQLQQSQDYTQASTNDQDKHIRIHSRKQTSREDKVYNRPPISRMDQTKYNTHEVVDEACDDENSKSENLNQQPRKLNPFNTRAAANNPLRSYHHHRPAAGARGTMNLSQQLKSIFEISNNRSVGIGNSNFQMQTQTAGHAAMTGNAPSVQSSQISKPGVLTHASRNTGIDRASESPSKCKTEKRPTKKMKQLNLSCILKNYNQDRSESGSACSAERQGTAGLNQRDGQIMMVQEIDDDTNQYTEEYDGVEATLPATDRHKRKETRTAFPSPKFAKKDKITNINSLHESLKKSKPKADMFLETSKVMTPVMREKQKMNQMPSKEEKPRENPPTIQSIKTPVKMGISLLQAQQKSNASQQSRRERDKTINNQVTVYQEKFQTATENSHRRFSSQKESIIENSFAQRMENLSKNAMPVPSTEMKGIKEESRQILNTTFVQQQQTVSLQNNKARILNQTLIKNNLFKDSKNITNANNDFARRRQSKAANEQIGNLPSNIVVNPATVQLNNGRKKADVGEQLLNQTYAFQAQSKPHQVRVSQMSVQRGDVTKRSPPGRSPRQNHVPPQFRDLTFSATIKNCVYQYSGPNLNNPLSAIVGAQDPGLRLSYSKMPTVNELQATNERAGKNLTEQNKQSRQISGMGQKMQQTQQMHYMGNGPNSQTMRQPNNTQMRIFGENPHQNTTGMVANISNISNTTTSNVHTSFGQKSHRNSLMPIMSPQQISNKLDRRVSKH